MSPPSAPRIAAAVALALTGVAGFVDAMCYLALLHLYTANMSGNSIAVGMDAARGQWRDGARRILPIGAFLAGLTAAGVAIEIARRRHVRRRMTLALLVEAACLIAFVWLAHPILRQGASEPSTLPLRGAALVGLAAIAMGAQNASLRESGVLNVYTTHVTGSLTRLSHAAVRYICQSTAPSSCGRNVRLAQLIFLASLWIVYVGGAAAGAAAWTRNGLALMVIPAGIVLSIIAIDLLHPLRPAPPITVPGETR